MGNPVSKEATDAWLANITPVKGEFRAFMVGIALGAFHHESKFGLKWERSNLMKHLQQIRNPVFEKLMWFLGQFCSADFIVPYFATLYWCLDKFKCVYGIWLVPVSEILNGMLKWYFQVPRPGWVDSSIEMKAWSHEYSFPSSHAQIIWTLATFFSGTSIGYLRQKLYGSAGQTALAYWYFLVGPFVFASMVCLSRVYEGLHYPRDVAVGAGLGVGLASVYMRFLPAIKSWIKTKSPLTQTLYLLTFTASLMGAVKACYHRVNKTRDPEEWKTNACRGRFANADIKSRSVPYASYVGMGGVLSGLAIGVPWVKQVPLNMPTSFKQGFVRCLLGNAGLFAMYFAIRAVEKKLCSQDTIQQKTVRFIRYLMVPIFILLIAPKMFKALNM